jgi:hypothetical protein
VTRIVDDRNIGIAGSFLEFANRALEIQIADVFLQRHRVKSGSLEQLGDGIRIFRGVWQLRNILLGRIADHQCDALVGGRLAMRRQQSKPAMKNRRRPANGLMALFPRTIPVNFA